MKTKRMREIIKFKTQLLLEITDTNYTIITSIYTLFCLFLSFFFPFHNLPTNKPKGPKMKMLWSIL